MALTIFYVGWLLAVLIFLILIYLSAERYFRKMEHTMIASRALSAQADLKSAEAVNRLAKMLEEEHHA